MTLPDFRITCIYVDRSATAAGLCRLALRGALDLIAKAGGGVVEGYPHDMATRDPAKMIERRRSSYERHPQPVRAGRVHLRRPEGLSSTA